MGLGGIDRGLPLFHTVILQASARSSTYWDSGQMSCRSGSVSDEWHRSASWGYRRLGIAL
jgi:hypothetical protein